MSDQRVIVIGAGLAGLLAARALQDAGREVLVLDKGRGVGGRMATRRMENAVFDHGAQFFTVRDPRFAALVEQWQAAGLVEEWARGFADANGEWANDGHARYRGAQGMTTVPKHLAQGLDVRTSAKVGAVRSTGKHWLVRMEDGETHNTDAVVMTPPIPQTLALLDAGRTPLPDDVRGPLSKLAYEPCIAVLALLDGPSKIPEPGGIQLEREPVYWLADNRQKGISEASAVTIHGAPQFSRDHWEMDREQAGGLLIDAVREWLGAEVRSYQTHGWRYARPVETYDSPTLVTQDPAPIAFAGDIFGGPRVEGAALSGLAAADALIALG